MLSPAVNRFDPAKLGRTFTIRANGAFVTQFVAALVTTITRAAPRARVRFAPEPDKEAAPLRDGRIDLEVGMPGASAREARGRFICRDRFVGAARLGHPLLVPRASASGTG